jgi:hypothetical protein
MANAPRRTSAQLKELVMSTGFAPSNKIHARDLFDGRLAKFSVREQFTADTTETSRCLTDGRNCLWISINDAGFVENITRYGANAPSKILKAIAQTFDTDIFSEYEPQYWGFDTQEEWDAWQEKLAKEHDDKFHAELLKYLQGEPNDIRPGTIGMQRAEIAKKLVENDPTFLLLENKDKLLNETRSIYDRDHAVTVTLSPEDIALVKMIATHEDDLSEA